MYRYEQNDTTEYADTAKVTLATSSQVNVAGHTGLCGVRVVLPFGVQAIPVEGKEVVMLPLQNGEYVLLGNISKPMDIDSGELQFRSNGGACIKLKNNGEVSINGMIIGVDGTVKNG